VALDFIGSPEASAVPEHFLAHWRAHACEFAKVQTAALERAHSLSENRKRAESKEESEKRAIQFCIAHGIPLRNG
jgi:hypothetical protein